MGARNRIGIELSSRPAILCSWANQLQIRFLESIPSPIRGLKFRTLYDNPIPTNFLAPINCSKIPALLSIGIQCRLESVPGKKPEADFMNVQFR
jgi:hypothetical protein